MNEIFSKKLPNVKLKGFATSTFQEDPRYENDIWGKHLEIGINRELQKLWQERRKYSKENFEKKIFELLGKNIEKYREEYNKHKVTKYKEREYIFQVDADIIRDALKLFDARNFLATAFVHAILKTISEASKAELYVKVVVNQYAACNDKDCKLGCTKLLKKVKDFEDLLNSQIDEKRKQSFMVVGFPSRNLGYWKNYIDTIVNLGGNAFRLSAEWSRLMTVENKMNKKEIAELARIIQYARKKKVEIILCFHHFTFPSWIEKGWENKKIVQLYIDFTMGILDKLEGKNALPEKVLTFNEPSAFIPTGYINGSWPPYEKRKLWKTWRIMNTTVKAHVRVYDLIKEIYPNIEVGFTENFPTFAPYYKFSPFDYALSKIAPLLNRIWINKLLKQSQKHGDFLFDFIGLQYYNKFYIGLTNNTISANPGKLDIPQKYEPYINGWTRPPESLVQQIIMVNRMIIKNAKKMKSKNLPPIMITETGIPSIVDPTKEYEIIFKAINFAKKNTPLEIIGVLIWTLYDNNEWTAGYDMQVGYYKMNGKPKPKTKYKPKALNLEDRGIRRELKKLQKVSKK